MSAPTVTSVTEASPAARAGLAVGDELLSLNGQEPRDVIDFQRLSDAGDLNVLVRRAGAPLPRVVRILAHVETMRSKQEIRHVYLGGAAVLRQDIAQ